MSNIFCQFKTNSTGICLMHCPDESGRCDRHKALIEKPKRVKGKRFRGDSKFAHTMGMFLNKDEN